MDATNQATPPGTTGKQDTSAAPQRRGGFVQGAAVAQGCCGETGSGGDGCCGEMSSGSESCCGQPIAVVERGVMTAPAAQVQTEIGCCGTPAKVATRQCCG
jgi:hypothetical protein